MKIKNLTLLLLAFLSSTAWAGTVTVSWSASGENLGNAADMSGSSYTVDALTSVSFGAGTNTLNTPKYYTSGNSVRIYPGNTMTVSGKNMTQIVLEFGESDKSNAISVNTGSYSDGTWMGGSDAVTFTVEGNSGHRRISGISVTYNVGDGSLSAPLLSAPFTFWPKTTETPERTVSISPSSEGSTVVYTVDGSTPSLTNGVKISKASELKISTTTTVRAISIIGSEMSEESSATYTLGQTVNSIAEFKKLADGSEARLYLSSAMNARVLYNNNGEVYLRDNTGAICLFMSSGQFNPQPAHNQHVAGWMIGKYTNYKGLPEFVSTSNTTTDYILFASPVSEPATEPQNIEAEEFGAYYADWIRLTEMETVESGGNMTVEKDGFSYVLYNKFNLSSDIYIQPESGKIVNVIGIAIPYGNKDELAPIYIEGYPPVEVVGDATGIYELMEESALSECGMPIYNISGQQVSQLSKGLYIVNGKKLLIK